MCVDHPHDELGDREQRNLAHLYRHGGWLSVAIHALDQLSEREDGTSNPHVNPYVLLACAFLDEAWLAARGGKPRRISPTLLLSLRNWLECGDRHTA
jgi:hypothetical protein